MNKVGWEAAITANGGEDYEDARQAVVPGGRCRLTKASEDLKLILEFNIHADLRLLTSGDLR